MVDLLYQAYCWVWESLDWLYPPSCAGCGKRGERWCNACRADVKLMHPPLCSLCGRRIQGDQRDAVCRFCREDQPAFRALRSWAEFEGITRKMLHLLKYRKDVGLGEVLSRPLIGLLHSLHWQIDMMMPVPMSKERSMARGYNQAALLARPLALAYGTPYVERGLHKVRDTISQVGLSLNERHKNVKGAFLAQSKIVTNKQILIVDDVATTGATLNACAAELLTKGARSVYCLTLARAPL
jgi:ComF family protein